MRKYKGVIFDLDGTLLDTLEDLTDSINHTFRAFQIEERSSSDVRRFLGNGIRQLVRLCVPIEIKGDVFESIFTAFKAYYEENCNHKTGPYSGIETVLKRLQAEGIQLAIVSNKIDVAVKSLNQQYFKDWIDLAVGETEMVKRKPAPDMVYTCLEQMKLNPEEVVYVGDSEVDLETAMNAGIDCISVSWGFRDVDWLMNHGALVILNSPEELLEKLL